MNVAEDQLFAALDETWPAARTFQAGPWTIREGAGGGQRVSAATRNGDARDEDVATAEQAMRAGGQRPLFMIRHQDALLDGWLNKRGYRIHDPVVIYAAEPSALVRLMGRAKIFPAWPPLAIQAEIWAAGGVGQPRLDVMARARGEKTALLGRLGDRAVATTFVACAGDIAMLHALEVMPDAQRQGVGTTMTAAAANWAAKHGATTLALMVTRDNAPANALYLSLGMAEVGQYHYRRTATVGT